MVINRQLQLQFQGVVFQLLLKWSNLDNMGAIGAAVVANDSAPMVSVLEGMAVKINTLTMDNRFTEQENQ